jgi:hypothetical protein
MLAGTPEGAPAQASHINRAGKRTWEGELLTAREGKARGRGRSESAGRIHWNHPAHLRGQQAASSCPKLSTPPRHPHTQHQQQAQHQRTKQAS